MASTQPLLSDAIPTFPKTFPSLSTNPTNFTLNVSVLPRSCCAPPRQDAHGQGRKSYTLEDYHQWLATNLGRSVESIRGDRNYRTIEQCKWERSSQQPGRCNYYVNQGIVCGGICSPTVELPPYDEKQWAGEDHEKRIR
ncbi:hypothetical protein TrLO_g15056 [Triparma laevis f. longispina]|uniref:Uncharacterized protein n=1 Tax=Triparma laevis f. longispina TaxID=1714387 RepID=A0A9W7L0Z3_9STRA|nr:hypothetical protein TrLO_g15056 [Triparma laevis f. longispina]